MKKIGFITTNKVFAQSLAAAVRSNSDMDFEPFLLLNMHQATLDAEVLKLEIAVVDVINGKSKDIESVLTFCEKLRKVVPSCHLLLLVSQEDKWGRKMAIEAVKGKIADDFVFYDTTLQYLLAKLAAL